MRLAAARPIQEVAGSCHDAPQPWVLVKYRTLQHGHGHRRHHRHRHRTLSTHLNSIADPFIGLEAELVGRERERLPIQRLQAATRRFISLLRMLIHLCQQEQRGRILLLLRRGERYTGSVSCYQECIVQLLRRLKEALCVSRPASEDKKSYLKVGDRGVHNKAEEDDLSLHVLGTRAPDHGEVIETVHVLDMMLLEQVFGNHQVLLAL